jgi:hypothetical protein
VTTAVAAPAPRPSDDELLDAIANLTLREVAYLRMRLYLLLIARIAKDAGL